MKQDYQAMARRHMWLSWSWGLGLSYLLPLLYFSLVSLSRPFAETISSLSGMLILMPLGILVFLGLPALLGAFVRLPAIRWAFKTANSRASLGWRTALVVEGSVLLLALFFTLGSRLLEAGNKTSPGEEALLFVGVSLPWLVSSVLVALHLWAGPTPESMTEPTIGLVDAAE